MARNMRSYVTADDCPKYAIIVRPWTNKKEEKKESSRQCYNDDDYEEDYDDDYEEDDDDGEYQTIHHHSQCKTYSDRLLGFYITHEAAIQDANDLLKAGKYPNGLAIIAVKELLIPQIEVTNNSVPSFLGVE